MRTWVLTGALTELSGDNRTGRGGTQEQASTSLVMQTSDTAKSVRLVTIVNRFMRAPRAGVVRGYFSLREMPMIGKGQEIGVDVYVAEGEKDLDEGNDCLAIHYVGVMFYV